LRKNDLWSGVLLGLSAFVRLSNFPVFAVLMLYHLWRKRWKFFMGLSVLAGFGILALIPNFFQDVFLYHVLKSVIPDRGGILSFISNEWILISLAGLAVLSKFNERKFLILGCALSGGLILILSQVYIFYLGFLIPFIALLAGFGIVELMERWEKFKPIIIAVFLIFIAYNSYAYRVAALGVEPNLESVFEEIEGPVFDLSASFGAHYAIRYDARISGKLIDMYHARVASGLVDWGDVLERLEDDPPKYIFDKRREFTEYNWREEWKKTPLKDFVYEGYVPARFVEMPNTQEIIIVWGQKQIGPEIDFIGNSGEYSVNYFM